VNETPVFNCLKSAFADLSIEIIQDSPSMLLPAIGFGDSDSMDNNGNASQSVNGNQTLMKGKEAPTSSLLEKSFATITTHKFLVSWNSRYLYKMLTSGMREGSENSIRLVTAYPASLRKLILSFYDHVLEIDSADEMIEMLYLADEYDMPTVMSALLQSITPTLHATSTDSTAMAPVVFTIENARQFLTCSAKLRLKLESRIFSDLASQWWEFGLGDGKQREYEKHHRNCSILLDSLNFPE
jgi:hypothetical protein